jgi:hypothetical protein
MSTLVVSLGEMLTAAGRVRAADDSEGGTSGASGAGVCVAALVADVATASLHNRYIKQQNRYISAQSLHKTRKTDDVTNRYDTKQHK